MKFADPFRFRPLTVLLLLVLFTLPGCTAGLRKARHLSRADNYFKDGDYDKAKIEYMNVLQVDPQNSTAVQRLGTMWFEEGAPVHAFPFLLGARQLAPENLDAHTKLGLTFLAVGQMAEARKEALAVLQKDPHHGEAALLLADTTANGDELTANEQFLDQLPGADGGAFLLQAKAELAMRAQDFAAAQSDLERALAADPKSPSVHLGLAALALARKDVAKAGQEFKAADALAPPRSAAHTDYAKFKLGTGARDEAKTILTETTHRAPDYLPAWQLQAQVANQEKNYDASLALLEHIFTQDADNLEARLLQVDDLFAKNDAAKATEILERLNGIYKASPVVKLQLARASLRNNDRNRAIVLLTQAAASTPNNTEAVLLLSDLRIDSGEPQAAVTMLTDLLKKRPGLVQAQISLANAFRALGRLDDAGALLDGMIKAGEKSPGAYQLLGLVQRQQNRPDDARASLVKARELAPDDAGIFSELVSLDLQRKDYAAAMQEVHGQLEKSPGSAAAHFLEAGVYAAQKDWDHAEAALRKTLELDPGFSEASSLLISTYMSANKLPEALAQLDTLLAKNPNNPRALLAAAQIYSRQNDPAKARDAYEKLLADSPDSIEALNNLAVLYSENFNQPDKAYDLARRARSLQPNNPSIADTLGWVLYKRADYAQALKLLQEAVAKLPGDPQMQFHLGMANYMMGQTEAARTAFERANAAPADFPGKAEITRRLVSLGAVGATPSADELAAAVKSNPGDPVILLRLGAAYEKQQAWDKAADAYQQALKINPRLPSAVDRLARLCAGPLHDPAKALELAKTDRELAPEDPQVGLLLGRLTYQSGNFPQAYTLLRDSARDLPNDPGVRVEFALAAYALGNVTEAREDMQGVVNVGGNAGQAAQEARRFLTLTAPEQTPQALAALEPDAQQALQTDPAYLPALMVRAALQIQRSETRQAADILAGILRHAPDFVPAQKRLAALYLQDPGALDKAYELAAQAHKAAPDDPEAAELLGQADYHRQAYPYAIQLLQESARRQPPSAEALYDLGMCYVQTKQPGLARETLTKAVAAGLPESQAAEAKQILAEAIPHK